MLNNRPEAEEQFAEILTAERNTAWLRKEGRLKRTNRQPQRRFHGEGHRASLLQLRDLPQ